MRNWFAWQRLKYHANKHVANLEVYGDVAFAGLDYGMQQGALWQVGSDASLGESGVLSLGEQANCMIGKQSRIGKRWMLKMIATEQGASLSIGQQCRIEDDVKLITFGKAKLQVADDCFIGWGCILSALNEVSIGAGTAIAEYVSIRDHNHEPGGGAVHLSAMQVKPVTIGKHVWIGAKVTIVAGVKVGDYAVIGANAVVTKDVPAGVKVAGVPARPIG